MSYMHLRATDRDKMQGYKNRGANQKQIAVFRCILV